MNVFRKVVFLLAAALVPALAACSDADRNAVEEAADEVAAGARAVENEIVEASKALLAEIDEDFTRAGEAIESGERKLASALQDHWNGLKAEASELSDDIASDWDRLASATGEEAEQIRAEIAAKEHELGRVLHEAKLTAIEKEEDFAAAVSSDLESMQRDIAKLEASAADVGQESIDSLKADWEAVNDGMDALADAAEAEYHEDRVALTRSVAALQRDVAAHLRSIG